MVRFATFKVLLAASGAILVGGFSTVAQGQIAIDIVGGLTTSAQANPFNAKGNVFRMTAQRLITEQEFYLSFTGPRTINYYVYQSDTQFSTYSLIHSAAVDHFGTGPGWYSSGGIGVTLLNSNFYLLAFSFDSGVTYYFNSGQSQSTSFGLQENGYSVGSHPLGSMVTTSINDFAIYYHRITTYPEPAGAMLALMAMIIRRPRGRQRH